MCSRNPIPRRDLIAAPVPEDLTPQSQETGELPAGLQSWGPRATDFLSLASQDILCRDDSAVDAGAPLLPSCANDPGQVTWLPGALVSAGG